MANGNYSDLLKSRGFQAFLWTQFLGAFNDNVSRWIVTFYAMDLMVGQGSKYSALIGGLFTIPSILFAGYSGWLADVRSKRQVLVAVKFLEVGFMAYGFFAIATGKLPFMLVLPLLMGLHATFFSPAKYGILPEILPEKDLSRANGLLEMTTFLAIILGTSLGGVLYEHWKGQPWLLNLILIGVAVVGVLCSLGIPKVRPAAEGIPFSSNPLGGIGKGIRDLRLNPTLWQTALGITYFWFLGAFLLSVIAPLGKEVMRLSDSQTSMLEAFLALGIGVGSLLAGKLSGDKVELGLVPLGSIGMGASAILLFFRHSTYGQAGFALAALGISGGFFAVPLNALLQQKAESGEKGIILATNNFMNALGMVLSFGLLYLFGSLFHLSPDQSILVMGLLTFGVTIYLLTILPDFLIRFSLWFLTHTVYRIKIVGQENVPFRGPALLVCNHVSQVDAPLVGSCVQRFVRFMMWKPYYEIKWLNWLFRLMKAIPVAGGSSRQEVVQSLERAKEELRAGHVVCIFAEGAISRTGNMLPFKRGFERIIEGLDVPIIPVHLDRLWGSIFSFKEGRFFLKWPKQIPFPVTVSFGKPLPATAKAEEVREVVQELGADATEHRKKPTDILPYRFVKTAKRNWFSFCMADSTGRELTFGKTFTAGLLMAGWVKKHCLEEKVGLLLPSSIGGALANLGVSLAGKVPVNLNFTVGKEAMDYAVKECGLKTILTSKLFLSKAGLEEREGMVFLEEVMKGFSGLQKASAFLRAFLLPSFALRFLLGLRRVKLDDLATVIFSSGSTGTPKGVMLTHYNVLSNVESCEQVFWVTKQDRILGVLPFFHSFGFMGTLWLPLIGGFGVAYHPNPLDAKAIGELVQKYKVTIMISTPTFYSAYARKIPPEQFSSVRFAVVGAEKLREPVAREFKEKYGLDLMEGYGATEMSPVVAVNVPDFLEGHSKQRGMKAGTVGHPVPGVAVKVVDPETCALLPSNQEGLLLVKGPNRMAGYLNQPEKTAEVLQDGWYKTGDIAMVDEDGFIRITDRLSRFSKIGGEMVPHMKVEEALLPLMGDYSCAVTSVPDEQKGEKLVVLYTHPQMKPEELWAKLSQTEMPKLWIPKKDSFYFVETIPQLGSGKLDLRQTKQLALNLSVGKE